MLAAFLTELLESAGHPQSRDNVLVSSQGQGRTPSISAMAPGSREVPPASADILCLPTVMHIQVQSYFLPRCKKGGKKFPSVSGSGNQKLLGEGVAWLCANVCE